jgi:hypothetical protein
LIILSLSLLNKREINIVMSIGVPIKLLHEAENHVVTVELKNGELYRGYLTEAEVICFISELNKHF